MNTASDKEILQLWRTTNDMDIRDRILEQMKERNLFPQEDVDSDEKMAGLYPDTRDPMFLQKLLQKQEFAENKQPSIAESIRKGVDPCKGSTGFELSPTQRFIGQYLSPKTPYMSALLFHGVGVGKTCSAITVAESYLEMYPRKQVIIVAPRNIQPNFSREAFNEAKLVIGEDDEPNTYNGCTGNTYLNLTSSEFVRDKTQIMNRVNALKGRRYQLVGYMAFYNYLKDLLEREVGTTVKGPRKEQEQFRLLNRKFSNRLIIIDEAHNVRDLTEQDDDNQDAPGGRAELSESQAGKRLTPYLRKLLQAATGTKLLLLTATPMYNSYKEIIPLLNLMLINDKKATVSESDFFDSEGNFIEGGEETFGKIVQAYVSFMRGENPLSFPIRLDPDDPSRLTTWPSKNPLGDDIKNENLRKQIIELPFLRNEFTSQGLRDYTSVVARLIVTSGLRLGATDGLVQAGNFLFPGTAGMSPETRIREQGFKNVFSETKEPRQFKLNAGIQPSWMHEGTLQNYSPKCNTIIQRLRTTKGVSFIYSRFVYSGALSIALVLEANGYENAIRPGNQGYLKDVPLAPGGKQCALCEHKQSDHQGQDHEFKQAKYVLLTGRDDLTPNNKGSIELATKVENKDGELVKVVIGSQVASEGIDLKFIREVLVFDSWFHLNKLEQVIGRGIRFCSHAALPKEKRNCTVVLLLTCFPETQNQETIEMYQYRSGFEKAYTIGQITRAMKIHALDCNLNRDAVVMTGLDPMDLEDSQGEIRYGHPIKDTEYTAVCDWIEDCDYKCATKVDFDSKKIDDSTYDAYAARWRVNQIKERLRRIFSKYSSVSYDKLIFLLTDIPRAVIAAIMGDVVDNRNFTMEIKGERGYITYRNGFYLFQPQRIQDTGIPLALRTALFPVKQDSYEEFEEAIVPKPKVAAAPLQATTATRQEEEQQVVQVEKAEVQGDVVGFWDVVMKFIDSIQTGSLENARSDKKILPDSLENAISNRYTGSRKKVGEKTYSIISMIHRFFQDVKQNEGWRQALATAASKMIFDEILNIEEQYAVYRAKQSDANPLYAQLFDEHVVEYEGEVMYRCLNPATATIEYKCGASACSPALVTAFEADTSAEDPLRKLRANTNTTGNPYGTVNYKNGNFVFKTNVPVNPSTNPALYEKQERGSECANVPNMKPHYNLLEALGSISQEALQTKLGFTFTDLQEAQPPRSVKNSVRACALTDIALRFFDELRIQEKRWFYRPLSTFVTKHPGILRQKTA